MQCDQHNGNDNNHQSQDGIECCETNEMGMITTTQHQDGLECCEQRNGNDNNHSKSGWNRMP